jgi:plastocyanin
VRFGASAVVALVIVASVACDKTSTGPAGRKSVSVNDDFFDPDATTISVGDTVYWIWAGQDVHNVIFDAVTGRPADCPPVGAGVCNRVFTTAGTFTYSCTLHTNMVGMVTVR